MPDADEIEVSGYPYARYADELADYLRLHRGRLADLQVDVGERLSVMADPADRRLRVLCAALRAVDEAQCESRVALAGTPASLQDTAIFFAVVIELSAVEISAVLGGEPDHVASRAREIRAWLQAGQVTIDGARIEGAARGSVAASVLLDERGVPIARELHPGEHVGRWRVVRRIARGGLGVVYEAEEPLGDGSERRRGALKILHDPCLDGESRRVALAEVAALAACFHPTIVPVWEWGWHEQRLWIAMPLLEGRTLAERMAEGPLSREDVERLLVPIAGGLAHIHERGLRHDDLKPENVVLTQIGEALEAPIIIDLGMARRAGQRLRGGTPYWMAPESAEALLPRTRDLSAAQTTPLGAAGKSGVQAASSPGRASRDDGSADVFALALMIRDALQPRGRGQWSASEASQQRIVEALERRVAEVVPPLVERRVWTVLEPAIRGGERPSAARLGAELVRVFAEDRQRRARRASRLAVLSALLLAVLSVGGVVVAWQASARAQKAEVAERLARERAAFAQSIADRRTQEAEAARVQADAADAARRAAQAQAAAERQQSERAQQETETAIRRAETHAHDREAVEEALRSARRRMRDLQAQLERTNGELATAQFALWRRASDLAQARRESADLASRIAANERTLAAERAGHGQQLSEVRGQLARSQEAVTQREREVERLNREVAALTAARDGYRDERDGCRTSLASCQAQPQPSIQGGGP